MGISTLSDLRSAVTSFLYERTELSQFIDLFIGLCESELNKVLKTNDQLKSVVLTPSVDGIITLPDDYQMFKSVVALTNPTIRLDHVSIGTLLDKYQPVNGSPKVFSITGNYATILPLNDANIELDYYAKIPSLSESNPTNWLLTKSPTTYLYGTLKHAAVFIGDTERLPIFASQFNDNVNLIIRDDKNARYGERTMAVANGVNP